MEKQCRGVHNPDTVLLWRGWWFTWRYHFLCWIIFSVLYCTFVEKQRI